MIKYIVGYILSILLTLAAYWLIVLHINSQHRVISHDTLIVSILGLAILQLVVQLSAFLHLGSEGGPRWKLGLFVSTVMLVLIVVIASIWIMGHLNYNMTPTQINQYLQDQQGGF